MMNARTKQTLLFLSEAQMSGVPSADMRIPLDELTWANTHWISDGISYLVTADADLVSVVDTPPDARSCFVAIECIAKSPGAPVLLILRAGPLQARLNGGPLPLFTVMSPGDELLLDGKQLHLALFSEPYVGPAPAEIAGGTCPICKVAIQERTTIYVCPSCGSAMHHADSGKAKEDRLECSLVGPNCLICHATIRFEAHVSYVPEGYSTC